MYQKLKESLLYLKCLLKITVSAHISRLSGFKDYKFDITGLRSSVHSPIFLVARKSLIDDFW